MKRFFAPIAFLMRASARTPQSGLLGEKTRRTAIKKMAEDGSTAVEYAMMLLLIFLACLSVVVAVGQSTATSFDDSHTRIEQAVGE